MGAARRPPLTCKAPAIRLPAADSAFARIFDLKTGVNALTNLKTGRNALTNLKTGRNALTNLKTGVNGPL